MRIKHLYSWLILVTVLAAVVSTRGQVRSSDLVHHGDIIEVDIVGSFEYDWRGSVTPEGFLDGLDSLEAQIYGLCRSENELASAIQKEFAKLLREPKIEVRIIDRSNRAVAFLTGAVRTPQRFQIKRPVHLKEILVLSGGITDRSSGEISIFRPANLSCTEEPERNADGEFVKASQPRGASTLKIKISDILRGDPDANPQILSGDIVTVNEALPVYVIGGVNAPQQIAIRNELTLSRVISMAGGLAKEGRGNVTIYRREARQTSIIKADLAKIAAGQAEDVRLKPFDIIDVPQNGKPERVRPPVIDDRTTTGSKLATLPLRRID